MNIDSIKAQVTAISEVMDTLTDKISELKKRADEAENRLRCIVWYAANVYDDKPHQFWNQVRLAAEHVADTESAAVINAYYENGCPFRRERSAAYDRIDRFLRDNLDDRDYAPYAEALEVLWEPPPAQAAVIEAAKAFAARPSLITEQVLIGFVSTLRALEEAP
jgi:hypothetical protein